MQIYVFVVHLCNDEKKLPFAAAILFHAGMLETFGELKVDSDNYLNIDLKLKFGLIHSLIHA